MSESENPAIQSPEVKQTRPNTNRDWWPNQVDLSILRRHAQRSGLMGLREGQKVSYELQTDQRNGKTSAVNLQAA